MVVLLSTKCLCDNAVVLGNLSVTSKFQIGNFTVEYEEERCKPLSRLEVRASPTK